MRVPTAAAANFSSTPSFADFLPPKTILDDVFLLDADDDITSGSAMRSCASLYDRHVASPNRVV
jgi:hypothetical protein